MPEIVYVLTNEYMPNIVKIGKTTTSVEARLKKLNSSTSVPFPFECFFAAKVKSCSDTEQKLHQLFSKYRISKKREFFKIDPEKVVTAISLGWFEEVTPSLKTADQDDIEALQKERAKRPDIKLDALGIDPDQILTLSVDESISVVVKPGNKVLYKEKVLSLTAAAQEALQSLGRKNPSVSGPRYWNYEGESLEARRHRMESEQFDEAQSG